MDRKQLKGVLFLVPTTFDKKGRFDKEAYQSNIRYLETVGVHGIVAMASMGQYYLFGDEEFKRIANASREACNNMACLIGTQWQNTKEAVARTKYAEGIGADAAFILPPYYSNWLDAEACYAHYKAIHDATSEVQLMVYNADLCGFYINIPLWDRLLRDFPRITAVKECTPFAEMGELIRKYGHRLNVMCGDECLLYPTMLLGGAGTPGVWATGYAKPMMTFYDACVNKRWDIALKFHKLLNAHRREFRFMGADYHFDNKSIVTAAGLKGGYARLPYGSPEERDIEFHKKLLQQLDNLVEEVEEKGRVKKIGKM